MAVLTRTTPMEILTVTEEDHPKQNGGGKWRLMQSGSRPTPAWGARRRGPSASGCEKNRYGSDLHGAVPVALKRLDVDQSV
ncbi:hypothetical protein Y032_0034g2883 [Ancylostoma ceylanicum]|uniref:Uncharacterized protein n=1 Tax=Ancylostoma ceylanicum TaxID=53326 RepID=A0A016UN02_9BILA|nr:hypothetical protein Y032_0034g2883 [Ancylostoma ceylanicum]